MKSLNKIYHYPVGLPLNTDQITEFHASRILLLIKICGSKDRTKKTHKITGLTKLAKLDFFVRYPDFLQRIAKHLSLEHTLQNNEKTIESRMIRFHYGPWDERYYQILPYLEAKGLIIVSQENTNTFTFYLTDLGEKITDELLIDDSFASLYKVLIDVKNVLASLSGSKIKSMIYELFIDEVKNKKLNEKI